MRLRGLTVTGFKTFARRSEISFDPGITAIVGPNGSGKSNIVDAIRWALGETNARELRGARMEEVIYSGGARRGRANLAEVELVLDNSGGEVASEDSEVAVSRRVTRGGESEYRLNSGRVRLRDLEHVLGQTGLTQTGYSVVAQNDIDGIIQATPAQRRVLVEQAAGIRALRAASDDALARVTQAEITLQRIEDLIAEAEPRLTELAEQAAVAIEQRELTERLAELRGSLAREEWRAARGQLRQARRRLEAAQRRFAAAAEAGQGFDERFVEARDAVHLARETQRNALARLEAARLAAERAQGETRRWADRAVAAVIRRATALIEVRRAAGEIAAAENALREVEASVTEVEQQRTQAQSLAAEMRQRYETAASASGTTEAQAAQLAAEGRRVAEALQAARRVEEQQQARMVAVEEAVQTLTAELVAATDRLSALDSETAEATERHRQAHQELDAAAAALEGAQRHKGEATDARIRAEADLGIRAEWARTATERAASLRGQLDGALGAGDGAVARAVSEGRFAARRLVEAFEVTDPDDRVAVEAALEHHLSAWLTTDRGGALELLAEAGGRERVVAPGASPAGHIPAGCRPLIACLVPRDSDARAVLEALLAGVVLAASADEAVRLAADCGVTAVLRDGRVVAPGEMAGGEPGRTLELADAERGAAAEAGTARAAEADAVRTLAEARDAEAAAIAAVEEASALLQGVRLRETECAALVRSTTSQRDAERSRCQTAGATLERRRSELAVAAQTASTAATEAATAATALAAVEQSLAEVDQRRLADQEALETLRTQLQEAQARDTEMRLRGDDHTRRLASARQAYDTVVRLADGSRQRVLEAELEAVRATMRAQHAASAAHAGQREVDEAARQVEGDAPTLAGLERQLLAVEAERSEVAVALARATDEVTASEAEVSAAQARVDDLADAVREDDDDEGPEPDAQAAERAEREIVRLERRIAALGPVNALAPEQHDQLLRRVEVWRGNRRDIRGACDDIRALARRLDQEMDRRFATVFDQVADHFRHLYAELFPGGTASLRLEQIEPRDTDDDEAAPAAEARRQRLPGVEILAQPAGKRLQPLSLLSGGERALTALSVILALQRVNPSPFYIFDEIDAPLDDANVLRLTRLLARLAEDQQFIVVTHNHVTMAAANVLYGVTIDGDGISSVISVRLAAAREMAEAELIGRPEPQTAASR